MLRFDPKSLASEFDPAIVCNFQYEAIESDSIAERFILGYGQYLDLYDAYKLSQENHFTFHSSAWP